MKIQRLVMDALLLLFISSTEANTENFVFSSSFLFEDIFPSPTPFYSPEICDETFCPPTEDELDLAEHCHLFPYRTTVEDEANLAAVMVQLAKLEERVSLLLPGSDYYIESSFGEELKKKQFGLCGISSNQYPVIHFNSRGDLSGDCLQAQAHSLSLKDTGFRAQFVELRFEIPQTPPGLHHEISSSIGWNDECFEIACLKAYALTLQESVVRVTNLKNDHATAIEVINCAKSDTPTFDQLNIIHTAGQGAALELVEGNSWFADVHINITGGGTAIRRTTTAFHNDSLSAIYAMERVYASGTADKEDKKPTLMIVPANSLTYVRSLCVEGEWNEGVVFQPLNNELYYSNQLCGLFNVEAGIFWNVDEPDLPYNTSRISHQRCDRSGAVLFELDETCPFNATDVDAGDSSGSEPNNLLLPYCSVSFEPNSVSPSTTSSDARTSSSEFSQSSPPIAQWSTEPLVSPTPSISEPSTSAPPAECEREGTLHLYRWAVYAGIPTTAFASCAVTSVLALLVGRILNRPAQKNTLFPETGPLGVELRQIR